MEDKEVKFCVQTYESCGSFRIYSVISFVDLEDLKTQLKAERYVSVGLAKSGWHDDYETTVGVVLKLMIQNWNLSNGAMKTLEDIATQHSTANKLSGVLF